MVSVLATDSRIDIDERDADLRTPLHWAVFSGEMACVMIMLEHGANAMYEDKSGRTAGYVALAKGNTEMVAVLEQQTGVTSRDQARSAKRDGLSSYYAAASVRFVAPCCAMQASLLAVVCSWVLVVTSDATVHAPMLIRRAGSPRSLLVLGSCFVEPVAAAIQP